MRKIFIGIKVTMRRKFICKNLFVLIIQALYRPFPQLLLI